MGPNARDFHRIYGFQNTTTNHFQCQTNQVDIESIRQETWKEFEDRFAQMEAKFEMMRRHLEICPLDASNTAPSIPSKVPVFEVENDLDYYSIY